MDYVKAHVGVSLLQFPAVKQGETVACVAQTPKVFSYSYNSSAFIRRSKLSDLREDVLTLSYVLGSYRCVLRRKAGIC